MNMLHGKTHLLPEARYVTSFAKNMAMLAEMAAQQLCIMSDGASE